MKKHRLAQLVLVGLGLFAKGVNLNAQTLFVPAGTGGIGSSQTEYVGIGTASPGANLEIHAESGNVGQIISTSDGIAYFTLYDYANPNPETGLHEPYIQLTGQHSSGVGANTAYIYNRSEGNARSALTFETRPGSGSAIERMRITNIGNVGVGVSDPAYRLSVGGADGNHYIQLRGNGASDLGLLFSTAPSTNPGAIFYNQGTHVMSFRTNVAEKMRITSAGHVGIGTTNPQAVLDLGTATGGRGLTWGGPSGSGRYASIFAPYSASGIVLSTGFHGADSSDSYISSYGSAMGRSGIRLNAFGGHAGVIQFFTDSAAAITAGTPFTPTERMRITASGNVGIGTTSPSHKLSVNGTIRAKEVIVEASPWPDDVFEADYKLKALSEVAAHIEEHGHLPDVPSAAAVAEQGVSVGEMQATLLRKIEELTLYILQQDARVRQQDQRIRDLEQRLATEESGQTAP